MLDFASTCSASKALSLSWPKSKILLGIVWCCLLPAAEVLLTVVKGLKFFAMNSSPTAGAYSTERTGVKFLPDFMLSKEVCEKHSSITKLFLT